MAWVTTNMIVPFWYVIYEGGQFWTVGGGGRAQEICFTLPFLFVDFVAREEKNGVCVYAREKPKPKIK